MRGYIKILFKHKLTTMTMILIILSTQPLDQTTPRIQTTRSLTLRSKTIAFTTRVASSRVTVTLGVLAGEVPIKQVSSSNHNEAQ